ncbi:MAG: methyltransferase [Patescibacteria group bacterium]|mgnify:FL=1
MDSYYKKQIVYPFEGKKLVFNVAETLFSTFDIDHGTDVLIRSIDVKDPKTILDIGCGYGPIGITMASKYPQSQVTLLDRDLLAVRYSRLNIEKNNIKNAEVFGSVGLETIANNKFDLIISNVPAKIGDDAIRQEFILTPFEHLNSNGELWVVVVNALNHLIPRIVVLPNLSMKEVRNRKGHTVYKIRKIA